MIPTGGYVPLIVRVAGLAAEAMAAFSHPVLTVTLTERERLREQLGQRRASLVDCLHRAIHGAAREERRFFLAMKRCCFNGGSLAAYRLDPRWALLAGTVGTLANEIVDDEEAIAALDTLLGKRYRDAVRWERESIAQLSESLSFMRGVALASPVVAQNRDHLKGRGVDGYGRREKRLCLTLLRYASRSALKLSPFATLTRTALGYAMGEADGFAFSPGCRWRERSSICLHRELLSQYVCLLLRCRQFAENLLIEVNDTLSSKSDGSYRFFRPGRWIFEDAGRAFYYEEGAHVRVKLDGCLVPWLLNELRGRPRTVNELLDGLPADIYVDDRDMLAQSLNELADIGLLIPIVPWDSNSPRLEQQILGHLDKLPDDSGLDAFRKGLLGLTVYLAGYADTNSPARFLSDSKRQVEDLFRTLVGPAALPSQIEFSAPANTFEEDVFLLPGRDRTGADEIARLSWSRMQALLEDLDPLVRFANLYRSRHDLLHALAAFGDRLWPGAENVEFLDFFSSSQPIFEEYLRCRRSRRSLFNPLELRVVDELARWRQHIENEVATCFDEIDHHQGQRLCPGALAGLLDQVPAPYASSLDFCAFVQPLDRQGQSWVVNFIGEGYGRFGGRFTASMDPGQQERWTSYFTPLSVLDLNGEKIELIDMSCPGGRTINVHVPQTLRVLKMPGDHTDLPIERVLRLRDLRVGLRGADRFPVLTDSAGQRLLPIQLGSSAARSRPAILKFLAAFGPSDLTPRWPVRLPPLVDGLKWGDRHRIGSTVYARRKWLFEPQSLLGQIDLRDEVAAFADINAWRLAAGVPGRVFASERGRLSRRKPQYIDFSSPSFVQIFQSMLKAGGKTLALEEALPAPDQFPLHDDHWAVEVQIESFCFRHRSPGPPRDVRGELATARSAGAT